MTNPSSMNRVNMRTRTVNSGDRYGRGVVLQEVESRIVARVSRRYVRLRCDCGATYDVSLSNLANGRTSSCGCVERSRYLIGKPRHGLKRHPSYGRWLNMMQRCYRPDHKSYPNYGGRGIQVHQPWHDVNYFIAYIDAVLGPCPDGYSIDRIDNDGNYEPGNIRWADARTQRINQRK